jgi:hypothetical protein
MSYNLNQAILVAYEGDILCLGCYQARGQEPPEDSYLISEGGDSIDRCSQCFARQNEPELTDEGLLYETTILVNQIKLLTEQEPNTPAFHWVENSPTQLEYVEDLREALERCWGCYPSRGKFALLSDPIEGLLKALYYPLRETIEPEVLEALRLALVPLVEHLAKACPHPHMTL